MTTALESRLRLSRSSSRGLTFCLSIYVMCRFDFFCCKSTATNRNKITPISITLPQNNNLLAYKHNRGISVYNRGIYLINK